MRGSRSVLVFLLVWALPLAAERLPLRSYGTAEGLPSTAILHILRDSRGFLWFSTRDGLARFDGFGFVTYGVEHGLPVATVNFVLESRRSGYWVATNGGGVCYLDPEAPLASPSVDGAGSRSAEAKVLFRCLPVGQTEPSNRVDALHEDRAGRIWAASDGGLFRLDEPAGSFERVDLGVRDPWRLNLNALLEDEEGSVWLGSNEGLFRRLPDGRVVRYELRPGSDIVRALLRDRQGRIWLGHQGAGLLVFRPEASADVARSDSREAALHTLRDARGAPGGEVRLPQAAGEARWFGREDGLADESVIELAQSSDGDVWIGSARGLTRFDGRRFHGYGRAHGLSDDGVKAVAEDQDGNLWIGGPSTAGKLIRDGFVTYDADGPAKDVVHALYLGEAGEVLAVSGDWQLSRFEGPRIVSARPRAPSSGRPGMFEQAAFRDRSGQWWIFSSGGFGRFQPVRRIEELDGRAPSVRYTQRDGLPGEGVFRVFEDATGDVWISAYGPPGRGGLVRWERATGRFHPYPQVRGHLTGDFPSALGEDGSGGLWIGFNLRGLGRLRGARFELFPEEDGAPRGRITSIHRDDTGRLWIGSVRDGLSRVDDPAASRPRFVRYVLSQGLASSNVTCVTTDRQGRVYAGTLNGVDRIDPRTGAVRHYTTLDGLPNAWVTAALRDSRGDLWFGTRGGLARLTPTARGGSKPPAAWIAGVRVGGDPRPLPHLGARNVMALVVAPDRNQVQIDFLALGFAMGERLRYQYRLEEEADWGPLTSERSVHYSRLAPGRHRFLVRAVNADGVASLEPASVELQVLPALWQRASVRGLAVVLLALALYGAHRHRLAHALALERVCMRIAADLHDEVGSSLSRVAILSEVVKRQLGDGSGEASRRLGEIAESARRMVDALGDVVWSVDPRQDDLGSVVRRIREFAADVLGSGVRWELHAPPGLDKVRLDPERRRQLYLILKEAVHNVARHAACRSASLHLELEEGTLRAELRDDGRGFAESEDGRERGGHGLSNMRARAEQLGARLDIESSAGGGTRVRVTLPLRDRGRMNMRLRAPGKRANIGAEPPG